MSPSISQPDVQVLPRKQLVELERRVSLLLIEAESQRMAEHLAQQPGLQMPDGLGPDCLA